MGMLLVCVAVVWLAVSRPRGCLLWLALIAIAGIAMAAMGALLG